MSRRLLEGPNIVYPQGGVAATLHCPADIRDALSYQIKTWAQAVGLIIGYLRLRPQADAALLDVSFTCNHPVLGLELLDQAVADVAAEQRGDADWSHDDALFDLRRRRMRADPGLPLLQLRAEAQGRGLPVLAVGDGTLQLGTGASGWRCDPAQLSLGLTVTPPWAQIAVVPLIAISGAADTQLLAALSAALAGPGLRVVADGTFAAVQAALLDPSAACILVRLNSQDALERGLGFSRCQAAVVDQLADYPHELALAAGLPALVADAAGIVIVRADDPRSADLAGRTAAQPFQLAPGQPQPAAPIDPLNAALVRSVYSLLNA